MQKTKVLITGGSGLLGQHLNIAAGADYEVITLYRTNPGNCSQFTPFQVDLSNHAQVTACIQEYQPDFIIHCGAVSNPEKAAAADPSEVYKINVETTVLIAREAERINARLLYTSTDLVYAGYRGSYLKEDAKLAPATLYAETKLMGEVKMQQIYPAAIVARVPLLFGFGYNNKGNNFKSMIKNFISGEKTNLFYDQFRTPLSVREAARILVELLLKAPKGAVVNIGGPRRVSRVELAEQACDVGEFDKALINSVSMDSIPNFIAVADVSLDISRLRSFGIEPKSLENMVQEEVTALLQEFGKK